jgi:hypothetical protein
MSTSHYSRSYTDLTSPYRTDEYPEPWADCRPRSSIQHSRPEAGDVGAETIRMPLPTHIPKSKPVSGRGFVLAGLLLMLADGCGLAYFCDSFWEAVVFCALTVPAGFFTLYAAWEIYSLNDHEDWTH